MSQSVLSLYQKLGGSAPGRWLFSQLVCWKAPYFRSIAPRIIELAPQRGQARIRHRRAVSNHLGTVHAIALCNLAEFIGGLTTDASMPPGMRWIPRGMQVEYLKKAVGDMHATASPEFVAHAADSGYPLPVHVQISNTAGEVVFSAVISMWVSPRH
ncbi:hotdog fold domain-containing protein [Pseudoxanthomonas dokdonensis]|uniref:DUF4442 domain-containing protein n=1 Tax=Pseudoxanthomonas dokdonensis TaxID=344882 RepID=A0A0R0CKJ3_9GAMM|nr:hotdog fold domain-containing protein [Pseudoxanthomonas dokdonensis]KRG70133.1 hypothetical protein ABB29_07890 [Pseudoxanthomonas dokdonensis]